MPPTTAIAEHLDPETPAVVPPHVADTVAQVVNSIPAASVHAKAQQQESVVPPHVADTVAQVSNSIPAASVSAEAPQQVVDPPPVAENIMGEAPAQWQSLLVEPLSVSPNVTAVTWSLLPMPTCTLTVTPTQPNATFLSARPPSAGSTLSSLNQIVEGQKSTVREMDKLRRQVDGLTRTNVALAQRVDQQNELISTILLAVHQLTATVLALTTANPAEQPTANAAAQPTAVQPIQSTSVPAPCPESEAIASNAYLSNEEARLIRQSSNGAGNFAAHLTQRLYPELFTAANVRLHFNYHGGGSK
ncbi:hypothetical protein DPMN_040351 [Dreissena polymorpha]|uniref:Uncharacterized protein n=1 Tax=Dreissena polymorpha TaxID=45954 RepID=A0A9D4HUY1_DREPO|nr:hypothetical protein DPMN_040351 [Dreissena polymorpha]